VLLVAWPAAARNASEEKHTMQIGIPAETLAGETRVAATPETVKKFVAQGHSVLLQSP